MKFFKKIHIILVVSVLIIANLIFMPGAHAGTLTHSSVLETGNSSNVNPMIASDAQQVALDFTPATTVSGGYTVTLTFGSGGTLWTQSSSPTSSSGVIAASGQTVANSGCTTLFPSTPTFLPGTLAVASSQAAGTITITSSGSGDTITSGTNYCATLTLTNAVTNPTSAAVYPVLLSTTSDSQLDAIDVLSTGANAYSITGTVAPTFTMALSGGGTDTFPSNLTSGSVTVSNGITTTINTNAASGWFVWAEDSQAGLHSTSASKLIPTVPTGANRTMNSGTYGPGNEYYGLGVSVDNTTNYAYGGGTTGGGLSTSTFNEIATSASPASGVTFVTHELANIASTTPPASDYTDTITLIGAGSF